MSAPKTDPAAETSALATARRLDAGGQHGDAFNVLKAAAQARDLPAMTELGHRLLVGDRAPRMPTHALALLHEAALQGDPRALARLAALHAAGAHVAQDWGRALGLLAAAAEAGDEDAGGQLRALQPDYSTDAGWRSMAARVPVQQWLSPAPVEALNPKVGCVTRLAPRAVCRWLIRRAAGRLVRARVYDAIDHVEKVDASRTNSAANFDYATLDVVQFLLQARMACTCNQRMQQLEAPMVLHYAVGQENALHFDFIDARAPDHAQQINEQGQRSLTFLLYLNDDYTGGETAFPHFGISHRGRRGDGLYFVNALADRSPDREMLHAGCPPTSGEKWIVSQFVRDIALRP